MQEHSTPRARQPWQAGRDNCSWQSACSFMRWVWMGSVRCQAGISSFSCLYGSLAEVAWTVWARSLCKQLLWEVWNCDVQSWSWCWYDPSVLMHGSQIPVRNAAKCLGYWWRGDMMALRSVEENIRRARKSFFHYGSLGAFQGDLSPLSMRSTEDKVTPL